MLVFLGGSALRLPCVSSDIFPYLSKFKQCVSSETFFSLGKFKMMRIIQDFSFPSENLNNVYHLIFLFSLNAFKIICIVRDFSFPSANLNNVYHLRFLFTINEFILMCIIWDLSFSLDVFFTKKNLCHFFLPSMSFYHGVTTAFLASDFAQLGEIPRRFYLH